MSIGGYCDNGFNFSGDVSQLSGQHSAFQSHPLRRQDTAQLTSKFSSGTHGFTDTSSHALKEENRQLAAQLIIAERDLAIQK